MSYNTERFSALKLSRSSKFVFSNSSQLSELEEDSLTDIPIYFQPEFSSRPSEESHTNRTTQFASDAKKSKASFPAFFRPYSAMNSNKEVNNKSEKK